MSRGRAVQGPATLFELFEIGSPDSTNWVLRGACADTDPEMFFPLPGHLGRYAIRAAKRVCASCTVRVECLEDALARRDFHGVRGGWSVRERYAIARRRKAAADLVESVPELGEVA